MYVSFRYTQSNGHLLLNLWFCKNIQFLFNDNYIFKHKSFLIIIIIRVYVYV